MRVGSHTARVAVFFAGIAVIALVYLGFKLPFISRGTVTEGIVTRHYMHGINKSDFGNTFSAEIKFYAGEQLITFLGPEGQQMNKGEIIPVIYDPANPGEAFVYTFSGYWLHGLLWCIFPLILWVAVCFSAIEVRASKPEA